MSRLGGGSCVKALDREARLEKLLGSQAYGGAAVPAKDAPAKPPMAKASASTRSTSAHAASVSSSVRSNSSRAVGRPPASGSNIRTISDSPGVSASGSRLRQTTEAYRQNRGTTARTVDQVNRAHMTPEKAAEVDRARAKVLGEAAGRPPRAASLKEPGRRPSSSTPIPRGRGHRLGGD
eukprot:TRINITY_DN27463_c0_g2_i1.p1 TRINITY_DN27463_c0_g2~~TRINITY_DN27463_c0_g2_i1.p1  ORF type:complete len:203 (+),score=46.06 TRINITY_DN27463_c0_g2_i1:75-611(+)